MKHHDLPVEKNAEYEADIVGLGHEGEGVGRVNGFTLFIPGALPGERVRVKVLKVKKQFGYAKLLEVLTSSEDRVAAPCPIYDKCGGCQLQHFSYEAQLRWKRQLVIDNLERIGKLTVSDRNSDWNDDRNYDQYNNHNNDHNNDHNTDHNNDQLNGEGAGLVGGEQLRKGQEEREQAKAERSNADLRESEPADRNLNNTFLVNSGGSNPGDSHLGSSDAGVVVYPTLGMSNPWRYRNKAQVPIGEERGGLIGGFYAQGSHRIIDMEQCLIQHEANDHVIARIKELGRQLGITAYQEETHSGLLRHVVVKVGFRTGEAMVVLITNGRSIPRVDEWIAGIRAALPDVVSIVQNINTARTNVIFGAETQVLWGQEHIYDYIGDVKFAISARSFYQVNPVQTEALYAKALEYAGLTGDEIVIDAYCGIGTISLFLARHARKVYGVEIVPEAISDAKRNAELNGIANVDFGVGRAEEIIPAWQLAGMYADVVVVDPPRKGCDAALLASILAMRPRRIVYVSCNASTLARDLRLLEDGGYRTVCVQPVDMFPHTSHVECVIGICRDDT